MEKRSFPMSADSHALFSDDEWTRISALLRLSPRESEIVYTMLAGEREADIADRLGISSHTVHCHLTRLYRKLQVNSRIDLLLRVFDAHLTLTR